MLSGPLNGRSVLAALKGVPTRIRSCQSSTHSHPRSRRAWRGGGHPEKLFPRFDWAGADAIRVAHCRSGRCAAVWCHPVPRCLQTRPWNPPPNRRKGMSPSGCRSITPTSGWTPSGRRWTRFRGVLMAQNASQTGLKGCCQVLKLLKTLAGTTGLEPATSCVTGMRSNQLNYVPSIPVASDWSRSKIASSLPLTTNP